MLWQNGWGLRGRYHGWDMDAPEETDGVWVDVIMHVCVCVCVLKTKSKSDRGERRGAR